MSSRIVADRLYALSLRPQELALYGNAARVTTRYAPMCDDPALPAAIHFALLVLEIHVAVPAEDPALPAGELEVLRAGWELELACDPPVAAADRVEGADEVGFALSRIAQAVNRLAQDAGIEPPLPPDACDRIAMDDRLARARGA